MPAYWRKLLLHLYFGRLFALLADRGIHVTQGEMHKGREFVLRAEQKGLHQVNLPPRIRDVLSDFETAHVYAFQLTFGLMGVVAIVGAVVCWLLVRKKDHLAPAHIFSRRSRWIWANSSGGPGPRPESRLPERQARTGARVEVSSFSGVGNDDAVRVRKTCPMTCRVAFQSLVTGDEHYGKLCAARGMHSKELRS